MIYLRISFKHILLVFILMFFILGLRSAFAFERYVSLDWEPISEASSYDLEIGIKGRDQIYRSMQDISIASWKGVIPPGSYWMRVRGRDDRKVPGEWSDKIVFDVRLSLAYVISPLPGAIFTSEGELMDVPLKWTPISGAQTYQLTILDSSQKPVLEQKIKETQITVKLKSAMKYTWNIQGVDENGFLGDKFTDLPDLLVLGPPLPEPKIKAQETAFVRKLEFEKPLDAEKVKLKLQRWDEVKKSWEIVHEEELDKKQAIGFKKDWKGGKYQLTVQSLSSLRSPSSVAESTFNVADGSRSLEAENKALIRKSIERFDTWFGVASYIISQMNYQATSIESNANLGFSALTGTLLLGVGKFWNSNFGFVTNIDFGGVTIEEKNTTFFGLEVAGLYRHSLFKAEDIRYKLGLYQKQYVEVIDTSPELIVSKSNLLGISSSVEFWQALTPKLGWQFNTGFKFPVVGQSSAGGTFIPSLSYQVGLLGSYRLSDQMSGLLGYSYRVETLKRKVTNEILHVEGNSEVSMTGHYLNLIMEYGF